MTTDRPWLIIAGGGTGGHLYPGLAIADALRSMQASFEVTVFGTPRPIDKKLVDERGYELVAQDVRPLPKRFWHYPGFLMAWRRSRKLAVDRFKARRPAVVLGLGGYASAPAVTAASRLGVPAALFNPDATPGEANRRLASRVDRIFTQWQETAEHFDRSPKVRCTGCPIRPDFARVNREMSIAALKLDPKKHTLLITGASQGARSINAAVMELIDFWQMALDWQIIHLTGKQDLKHCRTKYAEAGVSALTLGFTEHMPYCMAAADIVVSRAGASTIAEIMAMSVPSVLMPYPFDRHQHQMANARILADGHAAAIVEDAQDVQTNARRLRKVLGELMNSEHRRHRMAQSAGAMGRHDAALVIAELLLEMVNPG
jgi:UDP-N-acetylglucosamine--N-acetylmuramyl-(pentapeptide) pyrophosphoryl-undecaprenol N-acetylglucosamine transferase